jgi:hypothetical protein
MAGKTKPNYEVDKKTCRGKILSVLFNDLFLSISELHPTALDPSLPRSTCRALILDILQEMPMDLMNEHTLSNVNLDIQGSLFSFLII